MFVEQFLLSATLNEQLSWQLVDEQLLQRMTLVLGFYPQEGVLSARLSLVTIFTLKLNFSAISNLKLNSFYH